MSYTFIHCSACEAYHFFGVGMIAEDDTQSLFGLQVGDTLEETLAYFHASGAEPSYNNKLYEYDDNHYAAYVPVGDTGLVGIILYADRIWCEVMFDRQNRITGINVNYE